MFNLDAIAFQILLLKPRFEYLNISPEKQQPPKVRWALKMDYAAAQLFMKKLVQRLLNPGDFVCRQLQAIFGVNCL